MSNTAAGWKEATIAWEVCASIHREFAAGRDGLFSTRQADFHNHAIEARHNYHKAIGQPTDDSWCIYSENVGGNLHEATKWVNQLGVAQYLLHLSSVSGNGSIVILRLPRTHRLVIERAERVARYAAEQKARKGGEED